MELLRKLTHPPREFTPIPFWFLNGDLDDHEIERQLQDFSDKGVNAVVLHPRMGLAKRVEYLSDTYFHYIRTAVETAARLEMKVVLYDEGMYPSGSAGGKVVENHPQLASEGIALVSRPRQGDELLAYDEKEYLVARKSRGTIRGLHWGEDDGEANAPPSADILNPKAVDRFLMLTHEAYYRELKLYFGNTVIGFFTDEPSILGRNHEKDLFPWTHGFASDFVSAGGNLANLIEMFHGGKNQDTILYDRLILEREGDVYYKKLSLWCEKHGISLMGHPHQSDDIEVEKYFHIPGQDLVLRMFGPETGGTTGINSTMAKCSADAARIMGRRRNSNECFGACNKDGNPWQMSGQDLKWYIDWLAVRGVNLFIPHAFYYSIEGKRKEERPPDVGPHNIWWTYYEKWSTYMKRLSFLMTDCDMYASTAVLCHNRDLRPEDVKPLFEHQIGFQYLPDSVWCDCKVTQDGLWYHDHYYPFVAGDISQFKKVVNPQKPKYLTWPNKACDCFCNPPCPNLRVAHFNRLGTECWLLVNEGDQAIETRLTLPTVQSVASYDLWNGKLAKVDNFLNLPVCGSLLLFACKDSKYQDLPDKIENMITLKPDFVLEKEDEANVIKTYHAKLEITDDELDHDQIKICIHAKEMATLTVNGEFVDVGFWPPQEFEIKEYLHKGSNHLNIQVTGSLANLYGKRPVWYGIKQ